MKIEFQEILNNYKTAINQEFTKNPIAHLIRQTLPKSLTTLLPQQDRYKIQGSAGTGRWADIPWIAIFDTLVTTTAQKGYYPVFLFKKDMSGFYLSLNQGVTFIEKKYGKKEAIKYLKRTANDFRMQIDLFPNEFSENEIALIKKGENSKYATSYEAGNICSKYYASNRLPSDEEFQKDIIGILKLYASLAYNEIIPAKDIESEYEESYFKGEENLQKFRFHKRIERNGELPRKAKEFHGYTCKACKINFEQAYGELGKNFIEAHHMVPISTLIKDRVSLDVRKDFTVLCSNCHRMIHRLDDPSDLLKLIRILDFNHK